MERLLQGSTPERRSEALPRSQFHCLLDDQPDHLTPEHALKSYASRTSDQGWLVNPDCCFSAGGELPAENGNGQLEGLQNFALPHDLVWVREPGSGILLPFWLGPRLHSYPTEMKPGSMAPRNLPSELEMSLRIAGILVSEGWTEAREQQWVAAASRGSETFRSRGYVPLPNLIHPFQVAALRRYYRHLIRNGGMEYGDCQTSHRFFAHNESVARFFHRQLTKTVSVLAGEPVQPSYAYVASYQEGADLQKHTDREQCEFSITLCIDYAPEPRAATPWPLQLHTPSGGITVFQALGDGLLYRGRQIPHSRDLLPPGHTSTSIFFHYVAQDFVGSLD